MAAVDTLTERGAMLTELIKTIMATMISIVPPGYSVYSRVPIPVCDETCQTTRLCEEPIWRCEPPKFQPDVFYLKLAEFKAQGMTEEEASEKARPISFSRPETKAEALVRYAIIAEAIANVTRRLTYHMCKSTCVENLQCVDKKECKDEVAECHNSCSKTALWRWRRKELIHSILIVTGQESGFRGDVHGGVGTEGRGDCDWKYPDDRKAKPFAKGASPIPGTCRSVCLGQINLGNGGLGTAGPEKWTADDLVGVDLASTERCITQTARTLAMARLGCVYQFKEMKDWAGAMFSAYGTGWSCTNKKLMTRSNNFWNYYNHPKVLEGRWITILTTPEVNDTRQILQTQSPIYWMLPVEAAPTEIEQTVAEIIKSSPEI